MINRVKLRNAVFFNFWGFHFDVFRFERLEVRGILIAFTRLLNYFHRSAIRVVRHEILRVQVHRTAYRLTFQVLRNLLAQRTRIYAFRDFNEVDLLTFLVASGRLKRSLLNFALFDFTLCFGRFLLSLYLNFALLGQFHTWLRLRNLLEYSLLLLFVLGSHYFSTSWVSYLLILNLRRRQWNFIKRCL